MRALETAEVIEFRSEHPFDYVGVTRQFADFLAANDYLSVLSVNYDLSITNDQVTLTATVE